MTRRRTPEEVDMVLAACNIKRLGEYIDAKTPVAVQSLICGHIWKSLIRGIHDQRGCPECKYKPLTLTNKEFDQKIEERNLVRLDDYQTLEIPIRFQCTICSHIWKTKPYNICKQKTGCPPCGKLKAAKSRSLDNDVIDKRLVGTNIRRLDDYIDARAPIRFQCGICDNIWKAAPDHVANDRIDRTKCPTCSMSGYNEQQMYSFLKEYGEPFEHEYNIKNINPNASNNFRLDFYYPQYKIAIELNGRQHYEASTFGRITKDQAEQQLISQQARDKYIDQFCADHQIDLIWIDGRYYMNNKLIKYLTDIIVPLLTSQIKSI